MYGLMGVDQGRGFPYRDAMTAADSKRCPYCDEEIRLNALKCKFCKEWLETSVASPKGDDESLCLLEDLVDSEEEQGSVSVQELLENDEEVIEEDLPDLGLTEVDADHQKEERYLKLPSYLWILRPFIFLTFWSLGTALVGYSAWGLIYLSAKLLGPTVAGGAGWAVILPAVTIEWVVTVDLWKWSMRTGVGLEGEG